MAKLNNWVCPYCGKDCGNPPALELHKAYCKKKNGSGEGVGKCEHDFRLLSPQNHNEERALQDGFLQVCKKCKELE